MPIISIAVLILFQRSILRPWKKLNSLQFLPSLAGWQCFLHTDYQSLNGKAALGRKISCLGLQQPVAITDDIVQVIRIKRVMLQFQEVMSIYKTEFWCELTIAVLFWENADSLKNTHWHLRYGRVRGWEGGCWRTSRFRRQIDV